MYWDRQTKERLKKFDWASQRSIDVIRFDPHSGSRHRSHIIKLCQQAMEMGEHFITRARLNLPYNHLVADFYNIDCNTVVEVIHSEDNESIERKERVWKSLGFHFDAFVG